jgi:hypothetical protein
MKNAFQLFVLFTCLTDGLAQNNLLVVPAESSTDKGDSAYTMSGSVPLQQIYASSEFEGVNNTTILITGVSFRSDLEFLSFDAVIPKVDLWLSTSPKSLSDTRIFPSENYGPDRLNVYSAQDVRLMARPASVAGAAPFDFTFKFQNPYLYKADKGNLVLDIQLQTPDATPKLDAQWLREFDRARFIFLGPAASGSEWQVDSRSLITQFQYQLVPEPLIWKFLAIIGGASFFLRRGK